MLSLCLAAFALLLRQQEEVRPKSSSNEVLSDTHCISLLFNNKQERFLTLVSINGPNQVLALTYAPNMSFLNENLG